MNKLLDLILAVQVTTSLSWMFILVAHFADKYSPESWQFMVPVSLVLAICFMAAPYAIFLNKENCKQ